MIEIYDSHLHMGMLSNTQEVHPHEVLSFVHRHKVRGGLIFPTARLDGGDNLSLNESLYRESINIGLNIALYINKEILNKYNGGSFQLSYPYSALKIHPEALSFNENEMNDTCKMAMDLGVPLLIHTGENSNSSSLRFETIIKRYNKLSFILCHGRPFNETITLLKQYDNVYIDTAFISMEKLDAYIKHGFEDKILFGSDYPINRWFFDCNESLWYQNLIDQILFTYDNNIAQKILNCNFTKIFHTKCNT